MGFLDKLFRRAQSSVDEVGDRAKDVATEHGDKVTEGVHKAADFVDDKTGGRFADHVDKVEDASEKLVDRLDETPAAAASETKPPEGAAPPRSEPPRP